MRLIRSYWRVRASVLAHGSPSSGNGFSTAAGSRDRLTLLRRTQLQKAGTAELPAFFYGAAYLASIQASRKMFEFNLLTRRDWVLIAVFVVLSALAIGLGIYGSAN